MTFDAVCVFGPAFLFFFKSGSSYCGSARHMWWQNYIICKLFNSFFRSFRKKHHCYYWAKGRERKKVPRKVCLLKKRVYWNSLFHSFKVSLIFLNSNPKWENNLVKRMSEPGGARGATGTTQYLADQLSNPIQTGEGRFSPPITTGTPKNFHLQASPCYIHSFSRNSVYLDAFLAPKFTYALHTYLSK